MKLLQRTRRRFLRDSALGAAALALAPFAARAAALASARADELRGERTRFGLVTWKWGAKWTRAELIDRCAKSGCLGAERRTAHAHGVEVTPDSFHKDVPREKTIEQIGRSLLELGEFAAGYGREVRLEVHGECARLETIAELVAIAKHPHVEVCWNSNREDFAGKSLEHEFRLVREPRGSGKEKEA